MLLLLILYVVEWFVYLAAQTPKKNNQPGVEDSPEDIPIKKSKENDKIDDKEKDENKPEHEEEPKYDPVIKTEETSEINEEEKDNNDSHSSKWMDSPYILIILFALLGACLGAVIVLIILYSRLKAKTKAGGFSPDSTRSTLSPGTSSRYSGLVDTLHSQIVSDISQDTSYYDSQALIPHQMETYQETEYVHDESHQERL